MTTFERLARILSGKTAPANWIEDAFATMSENDLTDDIKEALLQVAEKIAYVDDQGQKYYDDLYVALYPDHVVDAISAVYTQSGTVYPTTSLNSLKTDLVVTAHYKDDTTSTLSADDYTLSGTLNVGNSTVTVTYSSFTTTFTVVVSKIPELSSISAVYTQTGTVYDTDSLDSLKDDLVVTAIYDDSSTETIASTDYTLSGTLAVGTSTITVTYSGKTTTFDVTVSLPTLDDIAFGSLTYRDLFITNNEIVIGDFETTLSLSSTEVSLGNGRTYKINAGSPAQTAEESDSPTHSLKCFGSSSTQILYRNEEKEFAAGNYLVCVSAKVTRYAAGYAGVQAAWPKDQPSKFGGNVGFQRNTNGFEHLAIIFTLNGTTADRTGLRFYIGSFLSANLDCYVDDVICTPVPSDMTEAQGLSLYEQYLHILREGL